MLTHIFYCQLLKVVNFKRLSPTLILISFSNGSLTREGVRDRCADGSWELFSQLLDTTPRGNFGNMGQCHVSVFGNMGREL